MNFPFGAAEISFQTNHPTVSNQKTVGKIKFLTPLFRFSPTAPFPAKPHLVGNGESIYPTYCGGKEIFEKSYAVVVHLEKQAKNACATNAIRTLFAPANKDGVDKGV
ncbi:MAG: hypothetical protein ABSE97_10145 [Verrucomicrobiota bacterium]|jgi:hypothetical protein